MPDVVLYTLLGLATAGMFVAIAVCAWRGGRLYERWTWEIELRRMRRQARGR